MCERCAECQSMVLLATAGKISMFSFRMHVMIRIYDLNLKKCISAHKACTIYNPRFKIGVTSTNKLVNNEMSSGISQSLTTCLSHNMQRRAFIIFIKTIFLGFLFDDPVSTPHSLWIEFRRGDKRNINRPYLSCFFVRHISETQVSVSFKLQTRIKTS